MTEDQFQKQIIDLAHLYSWKIAHFRPALTEKGWRTPVSADGAGFVDLVLVRDRVIFAEIKSKSGRLTDQQRDWGVALLAADAEYYTWRPSDWDSVMEILK